MSEKHNNLGECRKKYHGEYVAQVVSVSDPQWFLRVQVRVKDLFDGIPDSDLPWATYKLPPGSRPNDGFFTPCDVGDWVWVDFPFNGDTRRPRITGSVHYCPDSLPNFPHDAFSGSQSYQHKRTGPQTQPEATGYHRDVVFCQHGILIEIVENTQAVRITQKKSGSAVEIDSQGNITAHSENNLYGSSVNNTELDVGANLLARVSSDMFCEVGKNATINAGATAKIRAPQIYIMGDISSTSRDGSIGIENKQANTTHSGSYDMTGPVTITGNVSINGTLSVSGTITAPYLDGMAREANDN